MDIMHLWNFISLKFLDIFCVKLLFEMNDLADQILKTWIAVVCSVDDWSSLLAARQTVHWCLPDKAGRAINLCGHLAFMIQPRTAMVSQSHPTAVFTQPGIQKACGETTVFFNSIIKSSKWDIVPFLWHYNITVEILARTSLSIFLLALRRQHEVACVVRSMWSARLEW